jgi:FkbM family methyltransferase
MTPLKQSTVTINGKAFPIRYPDLPPMKKMLQEIFVHNVYHFLPFLQKEPGVIVDIGANIGCSVIWFRALYPDAVIFACEPARETFELLHSNTASLANVRLFQVGLFDRDCTTKLYQGVQSSVTNSVGSSILNTGNYETVTLRRASAFLAEQGIDRIVLLKLDTEGAEVPILRDLSHMLDRVGVIALEYHSETDRLAIDRLLSPRFVLVQGKVEFLHRGTLVYAARDLVAARTNLNRFEIVLPTIA